jgi:hypothetical protein
MLRMGLFDTVKAGKAQQVILGKSAVYISYLVAAQQIL